MHLLVLLLLSKQFPFLTSNFVNKESPSVTRDIIFYSCIWVSIVDRTLTLWWKDSMLAVEPYSWVMHWCPSSSPEPSPSSASEPGQSPRPRGDPAEWTVEEVITHIAATDPALANHADLFRRHVSWQGLLYIINRSVCFPREFVLYFRGFTHPRGLFCMLLLLFFLHLLLLLLLCLLLERNIFM